jgi:GT2 family glycosyltransferase
VKLSVVIVNYNVKYFLEQCLISVQRALNGIDAEVLVVDNASSDGSVEFIKERFSWVKLLASNTNLGFSKGNNLALAQAQGEYVLLLNPDTVVAEDTFQKCIVFMDSHPDAGALGVRMIDGEGKFLPESKRGLPTPAVAFYKAFGLSFLFPCSKVFGKYHLGFLDEFQTNSVEILSGAFMFIRKKTLDKTGLLDEDFFMYGEDIDLSYRIIKSGYKNYYFPEATIIHYKGESTRKVSVNYVKVFYHAMAVFARKHYSGNQSGLFSFFINFAIFFRGALALIANVFSSSYLFIIDAILSFAGIYFIKTYWENMIKYIHHYYPNRFLFAVVPVYIVTWIIATFLSGGYDKPYRASKIIRGIFFGTLAIAVIYAFLPDEWRFSRAMIILGALWTTLEMLLTRTSYHLIKHQTFSIENDDNKRALLFGGDNESKRAEQLLANVVSNIDIMSRVAKMDDLKKLIAIYDINELIFCGADTSYGQIIDYISQNAGSVEFKILNEHATTFIGSNSKNTAGDVYTIDPNLQLSKPINQRRKRLLDLIICLILLVLLPLNILIIKNPGRFLANWMAVLLGRKTWVGYAESDARHLPLLKNAVISVAESFDALNLEETELEKLDLLYAKNYSIGKDIKLVLKNYRKLGK